MQTDSLFISTETSITFTKKKTLSNDTICHRIRFFSFKF